MSYRIPDEEVLSQAIRTALGRTPSIGSQRELAERVNRELAKTDPLYRVSGERVRRVGIERNLIGVSIDYCRSAGDPPTACPVCGNVMHPVKRMTLEGQLVEASRSCTVCPYTIGRQKLMPARYGFSAAEGGETSDTERRIRILRRAQLKAGEAADLVERAMRMTDLQSRGQRTVEALKRLSDADEDAGSIVNLIRDLESEDETPPLWTRPTVSIKNEARKDI